MVADGGLGERERFGGAGIGAEFFQFQKRVNLWVKHAKNPSRNRTIQLIYGSPKNIDLILSHFAPIIKPVRRKARGAFPNHSSGPRPAQKGRSFPCRLHCI